MTTVQEPFSVEQFVQDTGLGVGGAQLAQHGPGRVVGPRDAPGRLSHRRAGAGARHGRQGALTGGGVAAGGEPFDGGQNGVHGGVGHLAPVQVALAGPGHAERRSGPHRPRVHLLLGLEHGDAPRGGVLVDRPVEGGRTPVADGAGVHDQTRPGRPHLPGDDRPQHRRHDQRGIVPVHGADHVTAGGGHLDGHRVPAGPQLRVDPLGEAVVGTGDEQDTHGDSLSGVLRPSAGGGPAVCDGRA